MQPTTGNPVAITILDNRGSKRNPKLYKLKVRNSNLKPIQPIGELFEGKMTTQTHGNLSVHSGNSPWGKKYKKSQSKS